MAYQQDFYRDEPEPRRVTRAPVHPVDACRCDSPFPVEDMDGDEYCFRCGLPMGDE